MSAYELFECTLIALNHGCHKRRVDGGPFGVFAHHRVLRESSACFSGAAWGSLRMGRRVDALYC